MKYARTLSVGTSLFLSVSLMLVGSTEASFAAATAKATPKATAKATPKATPKTTAKATPKASAAPVFPKPSGAPAAGDRTFDRFGNITTAQRACLSKQGVTLPSPGARPTTRPTGAPNANGAPNFGGGGGSLNSPKTVAAFKACKITLPSFGGGFNIDPKKLAAFQKCMTAAGIKSTNGFRYDQSDPDTAVALIKCQKSSGFTLPTFGQRGANN